MKNRTFHAIGTMIVLALSAIQSLAQSTEGDAGGSGDDTGRTGRARSVKKHIPINLKGNIPRCGARSSAPASRWENKNKTHENQI